MSSNVDIDALVYSFLQKKSPKCAKLFAKTTKPNPLPINSPNLEDILHAQLSANVSGLKEGGLMVSLAKQTSTPSSSANPSNLKSPFDTLGSVKLTDKCSPVLKKTSDTSDDSSSDSEACKPQLTSTQKKLPNTAVLGKSLVNSQRAQNNNSTGNKKNSDSSSDSEDAKSKPQTSVKKQNISQAVKFKPGMSSRKFEDTSDDSSSSSGEEKPANMKSKTMLPEKLPKVNEKPKISKSVPKLDNTVQSANSFASKASRSSDSSGDSSSSSDEEKPANMKSKTKLPGKLPKLNEKPKISKSVPKIDNTVLSANSFASKASGSSDSSGDLSSSSDEEKPANMKSKTKLPGKLPKVNEKPKISKSVPKLDNTVQSANSFAGKASESSDSDDEKLTKLSSSTLSNSLSKISVTAPLNSLKQKVSKNAEDSSSDDSSDSDAPKSTPNKPEVSASKVCINKSPITNSKTSKNANNLETTKSISKKVSESSDSSSDSDDEPLLKSSTAAPSNSLKQKGPKKAEATSSDDSSDSDALKKTLNKPNISSGNVDTKKKSPNAKSELLIPSGKKPSVSKNDSSDSSSESETDSKAKPLAVEKSFQTPGKRKRDESSSDSDSDSDSKNVSLSQVNGENSLRVNQTNSPAFSNTNGNISKTPDGMTESFKRKSMSETSENPNPTKKRRGSSPFRRIKSENYEIDSRLQQSSQLAKHELPNLGAARGKQFRHEKTKKKRGNHSFGKIDMSVKSLTFD